MRSKVLGLYTLYFDESETMTPATLAERLGVAVSAQAEVEKTVCVYNERKNKYVIVTPQSADVAWDIAHELGHIVLGHFKNGMLVGGGAMGQGKYSEAERQADMFADQLIKLSGEEKC